MTDIKQSHWSDVTNSCGGKKKKILWLLEGLEPEIKVLYWKGKNYYFSLCFLLSAQWGFTLFFAFIYRPFNTIEVRRAMLYNNVPSGPLPPRMYSLLWCAFKSMPRESVFPKQMKRAKANQKLVICRMSQRHRRSSVLSQSSCSPPCLRGLFFFRLSLYHTCCLCSGQGVKRVQ